MVRRSLAKGAVVICATARKPSFPVVLSAWQLQSELVPNVQNENRSNDGYNYSSEMKFAPCAGRIKQVGHGTANDRADNTEHDRPRDR